MGKLHRLLSVQFVQAEQYTPELDITTPGMGIDVEKALETYGFDWLERLNQYYSSETDKDGNTIDFFNGEDPTMMDRLDQLKALNTAYYKTLTAEERLQALQDSASYAGADDAVIDSKQTGKKNKSENDNKE